MSQPIIGTILWYVKLDSKYFDPIRVKPDADRSLRDHVPTCQWEGCNKPAPYRAPKGRRREGEYFCFCLEHVRAYNKSYNYFDGMSDADVARFQKSAVTGHRPTWTTGVNRTSGGGTSSDSRTFGADFTFRDGFGLFGDQGSADADEPRRSVRNAERRSLAVLGLDEDATGQEIKARFKHLAKRHHPDHNAGDKASEDKLREIIQAYSYLKSVGMC